MHGNDFYYIFVHLDDFDHHWLLGDGQNSRFMASRQTIAEMCGFIVDSYGLDNILVRCVDYDSLLCLLYDLGYDTSYNRNRPSRLLLTTNIDYSLFRLSEQLPLQLQSPFRLVLLLSTSQICWGMPPLQTFT